MTDVVYDLETYPNVFTLAAEHTHLPIRWEFEISPWRNDSKAIIEWVNWLRNNNARMIGFNNQGFDYPVLHTLMRMGYSDARTLYQKAMAIINSQDDDNRWMHSVKPSDVMVSQIDLYKIHHFDNKARSTSLKMLEFNMKAENIQDLPFKVGTELTQDQLPVLKRYNAHDVSQTKAFYFKSLDMIRFREELTQKYQRDFMNHNDTKIGKDYFIMELEKAGVPCYDYGPAGRTPRQTKRTSIPLKDAILPWITFENPEFTRVLNWLREQTITETKGVFNDLIATVNGFDFVFGLGGIHGSVSSETIESTDEMVIVDIDVESYYPSTAIAQRFKPAHFPDLFCDIYAGLKEQRKSHKKGTAENAMLKLALNGVYGDTNNPYSVFYDPLMTMQITLNGQLLLCKLAEALLSIPGLRMVQANTDGLTLHVPKRYMIEFAHIVSEWEQLTNLKMEKNTYSKMFIRDVNNYIAVYENGKVKRKGAYEYDQDWHQNHGGLIIAKVTEQVLVHGAPIRETMEQWPDIMDFMLRTKVPRSSYLQWGEDQAQNISRYYIAKGGKSLFKWMPPLKGKTEWRKIAVESGWAVQICNDIVDAGKLPIDFEWYIQETEKLCLSVM